MYRVLLVDDEILVRAWLKKRVNWESCGFTMAAEAANGKDALEIFGRENIDLILTDLRMPVMDGISLLRSVRESDKRVRFLILTCLDEFSLIKQAMELDASNYILKLTSETDEIERELLKIGNELRQLDGAFVETERTTKADAVSPLTGAQNQRLSAARSYLEKNYTKDISLARVAEVVGVTPNYLGQLFLQYCDCTFTDALNHLRIEAAKQLLENPSFRIYEVAERTGFSSTTYFFRVFKKYEGCTPMEYRAARGCSENV